MTTYGKKMGDEIMLKRNIADKLYSKAMKRIRTERPDIEITERYMDSLWFSIYGVLQHEGEETAKRYVGSAKISSPLPR